MALGGGGHVFDLLHSLFGFKGSRAHRCIYSYIDARRSFEELEENFEHRHISAQNGIASKLLWDAQFDGEWSGAREGGAVELFALFFNTHPICVVSQAIFTHRVSVV